MGIWDWVAIGGLVSVALSLILAEFIAKGRGADDDETPVPPAAPGPLPSRQRVSTLEGRAARRRREVSATNARAVSERWGPRPVNALFFDEFAGDQITTEQRMQRHRQKRA